MPAKQNTIFIGEDRRLKRRSIDVEGNTLISKKEIKTWYRLKKYYTEIRCFLKFWETRCRFLFIDENDALPVSPFPLYEDDDLKKMTDEDRQAGEALQLQLSYLNKKKPGTILETALGIMIFAELGIIVILALLIAVRDYDFARIFGG